MQPHTLSVPLPVPASALSQLMNQMESVYSAILTAMFVPALLVPAAPTPTTPLVLAVWSAHLIVWFVFLVLPVPPAILAITLTALVVVPLSRLGLPQG